MKKIQIIILFLVSALCLNAQNKVYNIIDFGAKTGLSHVNTEAIQRAINAASKSGGQVYIPKGQFVTGAIELKSNVTLFVSEHAELLGSTNRLHYGSDSAKALISAKGQKNVSIAGKGIINGRGAEVVKNLISLLHDGKFKDETWIAKRPSEKSRPKLVTFINCEYVSVKNVSLKNSAGWVQDFVGCNEVVVDGVKIESTAYWNNDGIDIVNSKNVKITNCEIDAADDGICLKSEGMPGICENIYVENCKIRSSANGFKIGTGSYGGFKNIKVKNILVYNTYRSAIALEAVDGGFIDGVDVDGVIGNYIGNAIFIRLGHRNKTDNYSTVKNIRIANVNATIPNAKPDAGYPIEGPLPKSAPHNLLPASIVGIPGHYITNVTLENIDVTYGGGAKKETAFISNDKLNNVDENIAGYPEFNMFGELPSWGFYVRHAKDITFNNVSFTYQSSDFRPAMVFDDADAIRINGLNISENANENVILVKDTPKFSIDNSKFPDNIKLPVKKL
ncbi:glycoside hydrolase family 28 protein [Pedobacter sp. Leaf170]|uniref:glycoside hydrolase family 28 protein n=1 Tax=Pedobacter sp. Leaf170 TaxID=2876558 RepID=UPI001E496FA0|nr:glycosyl hydrolase family 28 protein [Pedobacter sp. Leaf170]